MRAVGQFLRTYRVALIAVALATAHSLLFWSLGPRVPLGLFIAAVMVSAWQGGLRSAVVATALSTIVLAVLARYQAPGPEEDLVLRLGLFVLVGLIAGYLSQQCQQAIRAVDHVHDVLGGSGIALISADAAGRVTSLNPLARTLTGLGETDVHGLPLGQVFHAVHGPTRQPLSLTPAGPAQELPEGTLLLGNNGGETAVEGTVGPVRDGEGRPAGVMVVFREAGGRTQAWHELRQRADRFRALAGYAPAALMVLDAEGRCVFCNPAAQSACGCSADECLGEGWSRHVQPQDRDHLIGDWLRAVVGKAAFADEFRVVTGPDAVRWLRVRSAPMLADGGDVLGHVAALEDVTEPRRAAEALTDARRESDEHLQEWAASEKKAEEALRSARAEAEGRLQEHAAARQAAEESARKLQGQLDERGTALRRAQEALEAARAEGEQKLREEEARRQQAEEALDRARREAQERGAAQKRAKESFQAARAELERRLQEEADARKHAEQEAHQLREKIQQFGAERGPSREEVRAAARAVRDAWQEEVEAVVAMHLDARARLADELAGHREALHTTRDAHERLQSAVAEKDAAAESLRAELARLGEEAGAARQAHDRLQALLAQKEDDGQALRRELEALQGEAAARRQAEEAHGRLQSALGEKEQGDQSLRRDLVRLRAELGERQGAEERLRREKEFLEGVIDGSPAGIFAHDRDGRCRVWNPALERLLGRPRADALGRTESELFPAAEPDGRPRVESPPAAEDGADRAGLRMVAVIGRSELLESAHAPVRDPAGEVVGGMALVRVLPMPMPKEAGADKALPEDNGTGRLTDRPVGPRPAVRLGDIDWLAFN
jgi:PAS domain S-box-containing protein